MRSISRVRRALYGALALTTLAGCEDELPTLSGTDRFPPGTSPTTIEVVVPAAEFLAETTSFGGFTRRVDAPFLLVANDFDGALDAHTLGRFGSFPDTIMLGSDAVPAFTYAGARFAAAVDSAASTTAAPVRVQLYELVQDWDSTSVTWQHADSDASPPTPWLQPGGTRGELLAEALWVPADTAVAADTLVWTVGTAAAARLAAPNHPGVLIRTSTPGARIELESLGLRVDLVPSTRPDTTVSRTVSRAGETFVFDPPAPTGTDVFRVGGPESERVVLALDLSEGVPACRDPLATPACGQVPLRDVILNRATLVLEPVPVPGGFRPLTPTPLVVRRVLEPALGRNASLGEALALDSIPLSAFGGAGSAATIDLQLTSSIRNVAATETGTTSVVLIAEGEGERFGTAWFRDSPRLRLIYTLPLPPRLQ